ncbi:hypothetical protein DVQ41_18910 [Yersinia enterocolitica]|nr:hypothetical protein [Yersinia enterocolitica]QBQ01363.1 hypothetical protein YEY1_21740 [Yersinia enterocolitica subsp. palearctica]EKN4928980.1 hypothetical protein [Yersinia enterocolitica]EKN4932728.1 hypothetical protein [Yersinia enterocolitica]EKN5027737.1 hypothetical protein [Yersinia enterocolitica]
MPHLKPDILCNLLKLPDNTFTFTKEKHKHRKKHQKTANIYCFIIFFIYYPPSLKKYKKKQVINDIK